MFLPSSVYPNTLWYGTSRTPAHGNTCADFDGNYYLVFIHVFTTSYRLNVFVPPPLCPCSYVETPPHNVMLLGGTAFSMGVGHQDRALLNEMTTL